MLDITASHQDGICIIALTGRIISPTARQLEDALFARVAEGDTRLVLDFTKCDFIDSSGIRVLLMLLKKLMTVSGRFAICGANGHIGQIFGIAGLARLFPIVDTLEAATGAVKQ
jgi:anti-anti-sigma factor